ncbi:MAG: glycoside hydrolase family 172 protein [Steroidobacteraceae bacterium]
MSHEIRAHPGGHDGHPTVRMHECTDDSKPPLRRLATAVFLPIAAIGMLYGPSSVAEPQAGASPALSGAFSSPLSNLADPRPGTAMHEGSWDRQHQNNDSRSLKPGEVLTIFQHQGAGVVHRLWITISPRTDVSLLSQVILRMYWDGDEYPSVETPIGAFFGVGFGEQKDYISLPLNETSGGYNCYWPMPFHKSARWTLTNGSGKELGAFFYNIDYTALKSLPADVRHFHAQFRRENPTTPAKNYTILETTGAGHYVGTALFMSGRSLGFLEGNEMVYVDGSTKPTIEGTGTEDYFSSGWYFDRGPYSAPYHGLVIREEHPARVSAYRWHIEDAIPFTKSIRFTIEHGAQNTEPADYSSVAYYYLAGPSPKPHQLPADLLPSHVVLPPPMVIKGALEAENLKDSAKATSGGIWTKYMDAVDDDNIWSNGQTLFWHPDDKDAELTLQLPSPEGGQFEVIARMVSGPDLGIFQFVLEGNPIGPAIDLYASKSEPKEVSIGTVTLKAGANPLVVRAMGKNPQSKDVSVGIDAFILKARH